MRMMHALFAIAVGGVADCCGDGGVVDSVCADATPATPPTTIANSARIIRISPS